MTDFPYPFGLGIQLSPFDATVKRRAFFSFHYPDIMRVNNVRQAWKIDHPDSSENRSFVDSSLWETRKLEGDESVKRLIREGVQNTSAVCVLIGTDTWSRRWVRYEIARAVIDNKGLLGVHINRLNHHERRCADAFGSNPLSWLGVCKIQGNALSVPQYYLYEFKNGAWSKYEDYTAPVSLPLYLADPSPEYVMPLAAGANVYDYVADGGHINIGPWIDIAAKRVGR